MFGTGCKEILKKAMMMMDGELTDDEQRQFVAHIEKCPKCLEKYNIEKSLKEFLNNKIQRKQMPEDFITGIKQNIAKASDEL